MITDSITTLPEDGTIQLTTENYNLNDYNFSSVGLTFDIETKQLNPNYDFNINVILKGYSYYSTDFSQLKVDKEYLVEKIFQKNKKLKILNDISKMGKFLTTNTFESDEFDNFFNNSSIEYFDNPQFLNYGFFKLKDITRHNQIKTINYTEFDDNNNKVITSQKTIQVKIIYGTLYDNNREQEIMLCLDDDTLLNFYEKISYNCTFNKKDFFGNIINSVQAVTMSKVWNNNQFLFKKFIENNNSQLDITINIDSANLEGSIVLSNIKLYIGETIKNTGEEYQCYISPQEDSNPYYYFYSDKKKMKCSFFKNINGELKDISDNQNFKIYWFKYSPQKKNWNLYNDNIPKDLHSKIQYYKILKIENENNLYCTLNPIQSSLNERIRAVIEYAGQYYFSNILNFENKFVYLDDDFITFRPCLSFQIKKEQNSFISLTDSFEYKYNSVGEVQTRADAFVPFSLNLAYMGENIFEKVQKLVSKNINIQNILNIIMGDYNNFCYWEVGEKNSMISGVLTLLEQKNIHINNRFYNTFNSRTYSQDLIKELYDEEDAFLRYSKEEGNNIFYNFFKKHIRLKPFYSSKADNNYCTFFLSNNKMIMDTGSVWLNFLLQLFSIDNIPIYNINNYLHISSEFFIEQFFTFSSLGENNNLYKPYIQTYFQDFEDYRYTECFSIGGILAQIPDSNKPSYQDWPLKNKKRTYGGVSLNPLYLKYRTNYFVNSFIYDEYNNIVNYSLNIYNFKLYDEKGKDIEISTITEKNKDTFFPFPIFLKDCFQIEIIGRVYIGGLCFSHSIMPPYFLRVWRKQQGGHISDQTYQNTQLVKNDSSFNLNAETIMPVSDVIFLGPDYLYYDIQNTFLGNRNSFNFQINYQQETDFIIPKVYQNKRFELYAIKHKAPAAIPYICLSNYSADNLQNSANVSQALRSWHYQLQQYYQDYIKIENKLRGMSALEENNHEKSSWGAYITTQKGYEYADQLANLLYEMENLLSENDIPHKSFSQEENIVIGSNEGNDIIIKAQVIISNRVSGSVSDIPAGVGEKLVLREIEQGYMIYTLSAGNGQHTPNIVQWFAFLVGGPWMEYRSKATCDMIVWTYSGDFRTPLKKIQINPKDYEIKEESDNVEQITSADS